MPMTIVVIVQRDVIVRQSIVEDFGRWIILSKRVILRKIEETRIILVSFKFVT